MSKNRRSHQHQPAVPPLPPNIRQALGTADMVQMQAQQKQEQMNLMVRMFVAECARDIYKEATASMQTDPTDVELGKLAAHSTRAAEILGISLGMLNPRDDEETTEGSPEDPEPKTTEGGIELP